MWQPPHRCEKRTAPAWFGSDGASLIFCVPHAEMTAATATEAIERRRTLIGRLTGGAWRSAPGLDHLAVAGDFLAARVDLDRPSLDDCRRLARLPAEQGPNPGLDPQHPLGAGHPGTFGQPVQRGLDQRRVTGPGRRLGQLRHDKRPEPRKVAFEGVTARDGKRYLVFNPIYELLT